MVLSKVEKNVFLVALLLLLYVLECLFPYYDTFQNKTRHAIRNIGLIAFNTVVVNVALVPVVVLATSGTWGLFHRLTLDWKVELALTILIIDLLTYVVHVLFHRSNFLWRFHRMHHSDTEMDATSGARFHIGEHAISTGVRCVLYAAFGMKLQYIVIYETCFLANVLFHHANLQIGDLLDTIYRIVLTSPDMHKVHHSNIREEHDSNYTSLLSVWDRMFGTYRILENPKDIVYGIRGLEEEQTVRRMLLTPFRPLSEGESIDPN